MSAFLLNKLNAHTHTMLIITFHLKLVCAHTQVPLTTRKFSIPLNRERRYGARWRWWRTRHWFFPSSQYSLNTWDALFDALFDFITSWLAVKPVNYRRLIQIKNGLYHAQVKISPRERVGSAGKINSFREVSHKHNAVWLFFWRRRTRSPYTATSSGGRCCRFYCDDEFNYNVGKPILIEIETISSGCNSRPVAGNIISIILSLMLMPHCYLY